MGRKEQGQVGKGRGYVLNRLGSGGCLQRVCEGGVEFQRDSESMEKYVISHQQLSSRFVRANNPPYACC